jgi:hypothetical protein
MQAETATETIRFCILNVQTKKVLGNYFKTHIIRDKYLKGLQNGAENYKPVTVYFDDKGKTTRTMPDYDVKLFKDLC